MKLISTNRIVLKLNTQNKLCIQFFTLKMPTFDLKGSKRIKMITIINDIYLRSMPNHFLLVKYLDSNQKF
jgi:hypothetical protein